VGMRIRPLRSLTMATTVPAARPAAYPQVMVLAAWQRLTWAYGPPAAIGPRYATVAGSWAVYAAGPAIALTLALIVVQRRDV
jgi:ABC-2 type transport system permease protein